MATRLSSPRLTPAASAHHSPIGSSRPASPQSLSSADGSSNKYLDTTSGKVQAALDVDLASSASGRSQSSVSPKPAAKSPLRSLFSLGGRLREKSAPSTVQTDRRLPLHIYEPAATLLPAAAFATKQTMLDRAPLSEATSKTPPTGRAVAYSPYQPRTPYIPVTPTLVTKEDRLRIKKLTPRTPTKEMVKSSKEMW